MPTVYTRYGRMYYERINGKKVFLPGVTTILNATLDEDKKILFATMNKRNPELSRLRLRVGLEVHKMIERYQLTGDLDEIFTDDDLLDISKDLFISVGDFLKTLSPIATERPFFSTKHGFADTIDNISLHEGVNSVIDWKTSITTKTDSDPWYDYPLQVSAYVAGANDYLNDGLVLTSPIQKAIIVRMSPNREPQIKIMDIKEIKESYRLFYQRLKEYYIYHLDI